MEKGGRKKKERKKFSLKWFAQTSGTKAPFIPFPRRHERIRKQGGGRWIKCQDFFKK